MPSRIQVLFHKAAEKSIVNRLIKEHASTLLAAVDANRHQRGIGQAYLVAEGYILSGGDKKSAKRNGLKLIERAKYYIFGLPARCEIGDHIKNSLANDPEALLLDDLQPR